MRTDELPVVVAQKEDHLHQPLIRIGLAAILLPPSCRRRAATVCAQRIGLAAAPAGGVAHGVCCRGRERGGPAGILSQGLGGGVRVDSG